jgi:Rieske Fe-S protein
MQDLFSRRDVIKTLIVASAASVIQNKVWAGKVVSEVKARSDDIYGIARVQVADFPALSTNGGSVRIGSSDVVHFSGEQILPRGLFYPVIINRVSATQYVALEANCTHAGCVPNALVGGLAGRIHCDCHGSEFDINGNATREPARFPLLKYDTTLVNGILIIKIPNQRFDVIHSTVLNASEKRLRLSWVSFTDVEYELRWRLNIGVEPVPVAFSDTLSGPMSRTIIKGNDEVEFQNLYVVPTPGIYQIAIHHRPV